MIHLENPESQTRWYFKYFLGRSKIKKKKFLIFFFIIYLKIENFNQVHQNYMIEEKNNAKNVNFLSVVLTDANDRHIPQYKVCFFKK